MDISQGLGYLSILTRAGLRKVYVADYCTDG